jgi:hypothetical protein
MPYVTVSLETSESVLVGVGTQTVEPSTSDVGSVKSRNNYTTCRLGGLLVRGFFSSFCSSFGREKPELFIVEANVGKRRRSGADRMERVEAVVQRSVGAGRHSA